MDSAWKGFGAKQEKGRGLGARVPDPDLDLVFSPRDALATVADRWGLRQVDADEARLGWTWRTGSLTTGPRLSARKRNEKEGRCFP